MFANLTCRLTDQQMLDQVGHVLKAHARLTTDIIEKSPLCPGSGAYRTRFGSLLNAYARLGYKPSEVRFSQISTRQKVLLVRASLIKSFVESFPHQIEEVRRNRHFRAPLRYPPT